MARTARGSGGSRGSASVDALSSLSGNDLQQAGRDLFEGQLADNVERHRQIQQSAGDPRADFNAADEAMMSSSTRSPSWAAFFGLLHGKKMSGFGHDMFAEGQLAPGTDDTVEQIGPTFDPRDFQSGNFGPGSMASRSGLSQQALRALAGGR